MAKTRVEMDIYNKDCAMVILMLQRKQYRSNAKTTDDNRDATQASNSYTTNTNYNTDALNYTTHLYDNAKEQIPDLPVPQLDFNVGSQLDKLFELCSWYTLYVTKVLKTNLRELEYGEGYTATISVETLEFLSAMPSFGEVGFFW